MEFNSFIKLIQEYYNLKYDQTELVFLGSYFKNKDIDLKKLYEKTLIEHSKKWKSLPDISLFNHLLIEPDNSIKIKAESEWQSLIKTSSTYDVILNNPATAYVISGYGSWSAFCEERDNNREWTHKAFLDRWCEAYKNKAHTERVKFNGDYSTAGVGFTNIKPIEIGQPVTGHLGYSGQSEIESMANSIIKKIE